MRYNIIILSLLLSTAGCQKINVTIKDPYYSVSDRKYVLYREYISSYYKEKHNTIYIHVNISRKDLKHITNREIYTSLYVFDCSHKEEYYAAATKIGEFDIDDFKSIKQTIKNTNKYEFALSGEVPGRFFISLKKVCAQLNGGSMFGDKLKSNIIRVSRILGRQQSQ